jgi:hypothetical protein
MIAPQGQTIDAIVLMRRGHRLRTTTDKYRVFFDYQVEFAPISLDELAKKKGARIVQATEGILAESCSPGSVAEIDDSDQGKVLRPEAKLQIQCFAGT